MKKQKDTSSEETYIFWDYLLGQMTYNGSPPSLSSTGYNTLQEVLRKKKVGRWDEHMTDEDLQEAMAEKSIVNDVAGLITAWEIRTNDARKFTTPPNILEEMKSVYQLVSQIIKTIGADLDKIRG